MHVLRPSSGQNRANRVQVEGPDEPAGAVRHLPIGEDSRGARYFFFSGNNEDCRLYREEPPRKRTGKKPDGLDSQAGWETVCVTLEDLSEFASSLESSRNRGERSLYSTLANGILPRLVETANARKRAQEKAAALEAVPKKRSSRLQVRQRLAVKSSYDCEHSFASSRFAATLWSPSVRPAYAAFALI